MPGTARTQLILKVLLGFAVVLTLGVILVDLETTSRGWDAYGELVGAQRAALTNQPFYVGATDQKGPLWLSAYSIAYYLGGMRDAWWVVAAMVMLAAAGTAYAAFRYALVDGRDRFLAGAAAVVVFINLTLNEEEWGHVLYSRNIVSLLFACAFALIAVTFAREGRSRRDLLVRLACAGVLTGLAVQTNIASAPTAAVFAALVGWLCWRRHRADRRYAVAAFAVFCGATVVALLSALLWYTLRGAGPEFRELWWDYNRSYASGTGMTVVQSLRKGGTDFNGYYQDHPVLVLVIVAFCLDWARRARAGLATAFDAALVGWWLAECLAVALAQRFFDAYLVLPFVPVAFMGVSLAARYGGLVVGWLRPAAVGTAVLVALFLTAGPQSHVAYSDLRSPARVPAYKRLFENPLPAAVARRHVRDERPDLRRLRALVDRFSDNGDYVFAWTGQPETMYDMNRPMATRFGANNQWLWGVIPQGPIAPRYVIKDAWKQLAQDFSKTPPKLWIEQAQWRPVAPQLPLARIRDCAFRLVYASPEHAIYARIRPIGPCLAAAKLDAVDKANARARAAAG